MEPSLVDVRSHRFQLGVVGVATLVLTARRAPRAVAALAIATAPPTLPAIFGRAVAPHLGPPVSVEDARLPAFARVTGGIALATLAAVAAAHPSTVTRGILLATGALCIYGAVTGTCVPCSTLVALEQRGLVSLDPPLVCALRH